MIKHLALFLLVFIFQNSIAQDVTGKWKTFDIFNKNKPEAIVRLGVVNNALYIIIDEIIPSDHKNDLCIKCTDHRKDHPIKGMVILRGSKLENGMWKGAKILNAKNGKEYGCEIRLESKDLLKVRGFIGYPIFGKNLYWTRVKENSFR